MKNSIFAKLIFIFTLLFSLFWLMPLAFIFINSFKGDAEIVNRFLELPKEWSIRYYAETWNKFHFPLLLKNTLFYTVVTTAMVLLLAPMASYFIVRRKNMLLSKISFALLILPIMVPFQTYMISLTKFMGGFHLIGTKTGYIVVTVGLLMPLAVYIQYDSPDLGRECLHRRSEFIPVLFLYYITAAQTGSHDCFGFGRTLDLE